MYNVYSHFGKVLTVSLEVSMYLKPYGPARNAHNTVNRLFFNKKECEVKKKNHMTQKFHS